MAEASDADLVWHLYVLRTARGSLYTGVTTAVERRLHEHGHTARGSRALRGQRPLSLVYAVAVGTRGEALRLEHALKRLTRTGKDVLIQQQPDLESLRTRLGLAGMPAAR